MAINFYSQNIKFNLKKKSAIRRWIYAVLKKEKHSAAEINYVFCDDEELLEINRKYLKHNFLTDIITFQYKALSFPPIQRLQIPPEAGKGVGGVRRMTDSVTLFGEVFISIPRVKENAKKFNVCFDNELRRVMIHGILHLCGYKDKTKKEKEIMGEKENEYLKKATKNQRDATSASLRIV